MAVKPTTYTQAATRRGLRTLALWEIYDLLLLAALGLLLPALLLLPVPLLRVPLGLAAALLAPGYALTAALFPQREDLDGAARAGLSFGLSVAVLPLLALLLDALPWGIRPWPIAVSLSLWIVLLCMVAVLRRALAPAGTVASPPVPDPTGWWRSLSGRSKVQYVLGALALIVVLGSGVVALLAPDPTARLTEFYALGAGGLAEDYPREVVPGEVMQVQIGITNHEGVLARYRVEARSGEQLLAQAGPIALQDGATWEQPLRYALAQPGDDQQVYILLFRDDQTAPYRQLRLWVNVRGQP